MNRPTKNTINLLFPIICLISMLFVGNVNDCHAKEKKGKQHHSKDYKKFPAGSPEAVLTAFVEADLESLDNRSDDNRYPLWWDLTETPGQTSDDKRYIELIIKSYKIVGTTIENNKGIATVNLEMYVLAFYSAGRSLNKWEGVPVNLGTAKYATNSKVFLKEVLGSNIEKIMNKDNSSYPVQKEKRKWIFPVKMIKKNGKWVIANGYIPINSMYVRTDIKNIEKRLFDNKSSMEVCNGKLSLQTYMKKIRPIDHITTEIGTDMNKFKAHYCRPEIKEMIEGSIKEDKLYIQQLKDLSKE